MRELSWFSWFRPHGFIYGNFDDLRDTKCPGVQFWRVFRKMLRTMQLIEESNMVEGLGCTVEFQEERWRLELSFGPQPSIDMQSVANEEIFGKLEELVKKRIQPYWIEVYEYGAKVLFCIGPFSPGKTKYMVTIHRVRK